MKKVTVKLYGPHESHLEKHRWLRDNTQTDSDIIRGFIDRDIAREQKALQEMWEESLPRTTFAVEHERRVEVPRRPWWRFWGAA